MATNDTDKRHPLERAYFALKEQGLLRGSQLSDRVTVKFIGYGGTRSVLDSIDLVTTLMKLGSFDAVYVAENRSTGECVVERFTEDTRLRLFAEGIQAAGCDAGFDHEYRRLIQAAGGPMAVAKAIVEMGRRR